jgi:hypothetical protein
MHKMPSKCTKMCSDFCPDSTIRFTRLSDITFFNGKMKTRLFDFSYSLTYSSIIL